MCAVLDNINQITSAECYQKKKTGHGIMGTQMPKKFSYLRCAGTANTLTLPKTRSGRLIQFLLGDWSAEIS